MAMIPAKCTNCGANIQVDKTKEAGICESCGTAFITEKAINNYNINLENVIINSDTVNISHSTNLLDLSAIEKLLKNGLYDDAKKRLEVLIKDFPDNLTSLLQNLSDAIFPKYEYPSELLLL